MNLDWGRLTKFIPAKTGAFCRTFITLKKIAAKKQ